VTLLYELRRRWFLVAVVAAAGAAIAAGYAFTAPKRYVATAKLVVAPVAISDPIFRGLDVLQESDRKTAARTAAQLVESAQVADAVRLRLGGTQAALLHEVHARVPAGSDVVAISVEDHNPARAAQLANAFADALIQIRTAGFQSELATAIRRLEGQIIGLPPSQRVGPQGAELSRRLAALKSLLGTTDPTLRHGAAAVAPDSASWPHPLRLTLVGLLVGLLGGTAAALVLGSVRPTPLPAGADARVEDRLLARVEKRLQERIGELGEEQRRLAARESGLAARERDVTAKLVELRGAIAAPLELEAQAPLKALPPAPVAPVPPAPPAEAPRPAPPPEPAPAAAPPLPSVPAPVQAAPAIPGRWNLDELRRLVEANGDGHPDRGAEWDSYLFFLGEYAGPDGALPASFDFLVEESFAELLPPETP
jgi:hypothetical protein